MNTSSNIHHTHTNKIAILAYDAEIRRSKYKTKNQSTRGLPLSRQQERLLSIKSKRIGRGMRSSLYDIAHEILQVLAGAPNGMTTKYRLRAAVIQTNATCERVLKNMVTLGMIRFASVDERLQQAEFELKYGRDGQGLFSRKGVISDQRIASYAARRLARLYTITEKGRKLFDILGKMIELVAWFA